MLYSNPADYDRAIAETQAAISRIITAGSSRSIGTGGAHRDTSEVALSDLRSHLQLLQRERACLSEGGDGLGAFRVGAGW